KAAGRPGDQPAAEGGGRTRPRSEGQPRRRPALAVDPGDDDLYLVLVRASVDLARHIEAELEQPLRHRLEARRIGAAEASVRRDDQSLAEPANPVERADLDSHVHEGEAKRGRPLRGPPTAPISKPFAQPTSRNVPGSSIASTTGRSRHLPALRRAVEARVRPRVVGPPEGSR